MGNGLKGLIEKHNGKTKEGSFENIMCEFALEVMAWKSRRWKTNLFVIGVVMVPIVIIVLDKVL